MGIASFPGIPPEDPEDHPTVDENQKLEREISEVKTSMVEDKRLDIV